jgi:zinc protease
MDRVAPTPFTERRLSNGLTLLLSEDHSAPLAALVVMYHVGSKNETAGRTGFAHLFEHLMFKGSRNVADGEHFRLLQEIGASVNGSTSEDRTNYYEVVPGSHLELALFLEADRMGGLLDALGQEKLDNQRDVVKNERRQSYDNQPYGKAHETLSAALFPPGHPYSWPVIGSMEDLSAATLDDVRRFFTTYYVPANAVVAIAGDIDPREAAGLVETHFGRIAGGPPPPRVTAPPAGIASEKRLVMEDRVRLPRLYVSWHSPAMGTQEDAVYDLLTNLLAVGRNSRLYREMVFERQIAQSVVTYQDGMELSGVASIVATARPGHTLQELEESIRKILQSVARGEITDAEFDAARNAAEVHYAGTRVTALQRANGLATYRTLAGDAGAFNTHFSRFARVTREDLSEAAAALASGPAVLLSVIPAHDTTGEVMPI